MKTANTDMCVSFLRISITIEPELSYEFKCHGRFSTKRRKIGEHICPNTNSKVSKSALTGFVAAVVALSLQSTQRLRFAVRIQVRFRAAAPGVLGVLAVLVKL